MNTKPLLTLIAVLGILPFLVQAKSPWDKPAVTEPASTPTELFEPVEPLAIPAEEEIIEPIAAEPAADEPVAAEPIATEPVATQQAPAAPVAVHTPQPIEVIETRGDVLDMPQPELNQAATSTISLLDFPRRGMEQEKVQSELGAPVEIKDAVGKPPITRWIYNDRVVYFEYNTVLHVVAR
jgi:hypothetical protein